MRISPHANIFVQRYAREAAGIFCRCIFRKVFSSPNLADKAEHIVANGIAEITSTESTTPIIWGYDTLGSLFGMSAALPAATGLMTTNPPDFYAWHKHSRSKRTGRVVESICGGASVWWRSRCTDDGRRNDPTATNIRHVEVMTDIPNETTAFADSWFLDDAVNPTSTSTTNVADDRVPPMAGLPSMACGTLNRKDGSGLCG